MGFAGAYGKAWSILFWNKVLLYCTLLSAQETFMRVENVNMKFWLQIRLIQKYVLTTQPFACICLSVPLSLWNTSLSLFYVLIMAIIVTTHLTAGSMSFSSETHRAVWLQHPEGWTRRQKNKTFSIELPQLSCCCSNLDLAAELGRDERGNKVRWTLMWAEARVTSATVPVPCKQIPACSRKPALLTQPNFSAAPWTGAVLPPRAPLPRPTCQGLAKDHLSWRTPAFWNLRQILSLPTDLHWEACWEQIWIYQDLALHFSEAEMSCNTIQHSLKCCLRLPRLKGSITSPTLLVIKTMDIIIPCAGSGVCEGEKASHKFY